MNRLKEVRKFLGLTQQKLADKLQYKQYKIADIESEKQKINIELANKLKDLFLINGWWLLTGQGSMLLNNENENNQSVAIVNNTNGAIVNNGNGNIHINKKQFENGNEVEELIELLGYAPPSFLHNVKSKLLSFKKDCEI